MVPSAFPRTKARTIYFHRMGEFERLIGAKSRPGPGWRTRGHGKREQEEGSRPRMGFCAGPPITDTA